MEADHVTAWSKGGDKPNPKYPERKLRPNRPVDVVSPFDSAR